MNKINTFKAAYSIFADDKLNNLFMKEGIKPSKVTIRKLQGVVFCKKISGTLFVNRRKRH